MSARPQAIGGGPAAESEYLPEHQVPVGGFDLQRWTALCERLRVVDPRGRFGTLNDAYTDPRRHYHGAEHISDCLDVFDEAAALAAIHPDELEFAIWLHDVVYDPRRSDNEERSAEVAAGWLPSDESAVADRVRNLILATRHESPPSTPDEALVQDIDLHTLGSDQERFDRYEMGVRREYAGIPDATFRWGRRRILAQFLRREHLFNTPWFRNRFEARARANLERALERL